MSHTITPVAQYDAAAITLPDDGDANTIESLDPAFQKLADRAQFGFSGVASRIQWAETITVDANGSSSSFAVHVGGIQMIVLARVDGTYRLASAIAATLTAAHLESGTTLGNSEWRYIYAYDPGDGTVAYQLSTTAPTASLTFKSGAGGFVYRYLGCFRTNGSGAPIPSRSIRGVTTYLQALPTGYVSLSGPTTGYESVSLAALVPPHARCATADVTLTGDGQWRCIGDAGGVSGVNRFNTPIVLNASQEIEWSSAMTGGITVAVRTYSA